MWITVVIEILEPKYRFVDGHPGHIDHRNSDTNLTMVIEILEPKYRFADGHPGHIDHRNSDTNLITSFGLLAKPVIEESVSKLLLA